MVNKKYDWDKILNEFIEGKYINVKEFVEYCAGKGNGYPSVSAIYKKSAKEGWSEKKQERYRKNAEKYVNQALSKAEENEIENILQLNRRLTIAQVNLVNTVIKKIQAGEMDGINIRIDYSDAINDLKRSLNQRTKEQDQKTENQLNINNAQISGEEVDPRKVIENMTEDELRLFFEKRKTELQEPKTIEVDGEVVEEVEFKDASD